MRRGRSRYAWALLLIGAALALTTQPASAQEDDGHLAETPPMGWNSWYQYGKAIDEDLIREQADAMVASGMRDTGYEYLIVDGGWRARTRDAAGDMQVDPEKFPSGMKAVADYVHSKGLEFSHFSLWAMLAAPLIASPDMRDMSDATREILLNEEVIAIDQDPAGVQGRRIRDSGDEEVWARPLADGSVAVALFNRAEAGATMAVGAGELGLPEADAYVMRDVWAHRTTAAADTVSAFVPSHGTALFTVRPGEPSEAEPATVLAIDGAEELVAGERGAITTTVTNLGRVAIQDVTQSLDVPPGWEIEPAAGTQPAELAPRRSASVAWHVRPPAGVDPGKTQELTAAARFRQGEAWTSTESQVHVLVDPFREYVPQSEMTATASSVFGDGATPDLAIDGDPATFWHSARVARDPLPATVTLDLGRLRGVEGLTYLPRQDGQDNGHITRFAVSVSTDGSAYTEVASGEWAGDAKLKAIGWPAMAARYVRLEAVDGVDGVASAAEIDVAADGGP